MRTKRLAVGFSLVFSAFLLAACQTAPKRSFPKSSETIRVASPNGQFDAVLVTDLYGGAVGGGVDSMVFIVRKGAPVGAKPGSEIFRADPMTGARLVWERDHLLEIHFDIANIHAFRNVWGLYEIENVGSVGERNFEIEIRLVPTSDSSALKPDGSFRSPGSE